MYRGEWNDAAQKLQLALDIYTAYQANLAPIRIYQALLALLMSRYKPNSGKLKDALKFASQASELVGREDTSERELLARTGY